MYKILKIFNLMCVIMQFALHNAMCVLRIIMEFPLHHMKWCNDARNYGGLALAN